MSYGKIVVKKKSLRGQIKKNTWLTDALGLNLLYLYEKSTFNHNILDVSVDLLNFDIHATVLYNSIQTH